MNVTNFSGLVRRQTRSFRRAQTRSGGKFSAVHAWKADWTDAARIDAAIPFPQTSATTMSTAPSPLTKKS